MPSLPDDIVNAQAQLVKSLRSGGPLSQQTDALYRRLCKLLEDFAFASGDIIKAEDYMWRYLHLRVIEVFRAGIEKPPHDGNNDQGDPHRSKRADGDSARALQAGFRVFLNNSIGFYLEFIRKLHAREPLAAVQRAVMADIASCMEFSDLHGARYKDTLSGRTLREARCLLSKRFYNMAVRLIPDNGHPFNQLSVIASKYEMDLLRAFELYFRSLAISIPYRIALENIHTTCVEAQTRVKAKVASPEVPPFASVFKAHIGALLWKVSSPEAIAAESQSVISGIEAFLSDPALRKRLNISPDDIKSILVVSLGAVFLSESPETFSQRSNKHHSTASGTGGGKHGKRTDLAPHDPSVVLDFTWNLVRVVLKYVLALARSQISKGVVWSGSDSGQSSDELDFFEPLLPHVKLALKFLSNRVKQGMYLGSLTPDYWPLVASVCTVLSEAHARLWNRMPDEVALLAPTLLPEDLEWQGFSVLYPSGGRPTPAEWDASIPLGEMAPIRIAQILEIANELCATMPPRLFFSMFQSADKRYRMFSTVPPENPSIAFTSVTARGGLLPAGIWARDQNRTAIEKTVRFAQQWKVPDIKEALGITDIESTTINVCQRQLLLWLPSLLVLVFGNFLDHKRKSASLSRSKRHAKRVLGAALVAMNGMLAVMYTLLWLDLLPTLPASEPGHVVSPARFLTLMAYTPPLLHLMGDLTSHEGNIRAYAKLSYLQIIVMFLSSFVDAGRSQLATLVWVVSTFAIIRRVLVLHGSALKRASHALLDRRSLVLTRLFSVAGMCTCFERAMIVDHVASETLYSIGDSASVASLTAILAFSTPRELEER
nr:hypothetical protein HK105_004037 [Polyrhizophydium stewartii]